MALENAAEQAFAIFMREIGFPPEHSLHLRNTPHRVTKMFREMFYGVDKEPKLTAFDIEEYVPGHVGDPGIVVVRDIPFYSICAHHFLPFFGTAHVAYIPERKLLGLSKFARVVTAMAAGPQVQEDIGSQTADYIQKILQPLAIGVVLQATHMCMSARGVKAHGASTVTSALRGIFFSDARAREEMYRLITIPHGGGF